MTQTVKAKHTEGPWEVRKRPYHFNIHAPNGAVIANVDKYRPDDARLIAAAPTLLEALLALVDGAQIRSTHNGRLYSGDFWSVTQEAIDAARAAIRRAEGEE